MFAGSAQIEAGRLRVAEMPAAKNAAQEETMKTMFPREMIKRCALNFPDKAAYLCGDRASTWREMDERSDRFAKALQDLGIGKGDVVSILSLESIEVYEHFFASMKLGTVRVGVNTLYAWPEVRHLLLDSATKVLMVDARIRTMVDMHRAEIEGFGIVLVGYNGEHDYHHDYELMLGGVVGTPSWPPLDDDDLLLYSYTSGTTGVPKGVMLTQIGGVSVIQNCLVSFGFGPDDVWYMPAASAWVVVIMKVFGLGNGMTSVVPDGNFQITTFMRDVERLGVTAVLMVPTMIQRALIDHAANRYDLSKLRLIAYGSAPATPKLIRDARAQFGVEMLQTYGQTETTGGWLTVLTEKDHQKGLTTQPELLRSVGRVGLHYECSIRDDEGVPLPAGARGEIWLRGASVMKGYLNLPGATAEVLRDGWLRTNDIGRMDESGYLYLLDRQKFMIITGAVNVFPTTVESVLSEHPAVLEVAVVGLPHPEWGEAVVAVAVARSTHRDVTAADLITFCHGKLSRPETPKHVVFVEELMKTVNGKLRKADIRNWLLRAEEPLVPWCMTIE